MNDVEVTYDFPAPYALITKKDSLGRTAAIEADSVRIIAGGGRTGGATDIIVSGLVRSTKPGARPARYADRRELEFFDGGPGSIHHYDANATIRGYIDTVQAWELRRLGGTFAQDDPRDNIEF